MCRLFHLPVVPRKMLKLEFLGAIKIAKTPYFGYPSLPSGKSVNFLPIFLEAKIWKECTSSTLDNFYFHVEENCSTRFYITAHER